MHGGLSQFKALVARRKELPSSGKKRFDSSKVKRTTKTGIQEPVISDFELKKIKDRIQAESRTERLRYYTIATLALLLFCGILYFLLF
ncbi:hypothetical protein GWK08_08070 [Leptobacterium flavescens]|uniref:Uncharacterized protein n=1 Tax=Leptobacterium flavescens TaxID=472055 RepID=A0A6P0UNG7_9FLAO|nr:hypothetical protein [Leptobacterium flavescens]NER13389.1 hypothetical protein [Leptobacterium flavescens]